MSMTENEAKKWLERFEWDDSEETSEALATICEALQEYPKFKEIGTIEEFKALKEKSVAKKPRYEFRYEYRCPVCNDKVTINTDFCDDYQLGHCESCGQKLDWLKE